MSYLSAFLSVIFLKLDFKASDVTGAVYCPYVS